jgi:hypothetical protein
MVKTDGEWAFEEEIHVGFFKVLYVYSKGNEIKVEDAEGNLKYTGEAPDLVVRDRYRRMIAKIKEAGL